MLKQLVVCIVALFLVFQEFFAGPKGVGVAMTAGMLIYAATTIVAVFRLFPISPPDALKQISGIYLPSFYCLIVVGLIINTIGTEADVMTTLIGYGLFLVASIPLLVFAHRLLDLRKMFSILRAPHG